MVGKRRFYALLLIGVLALAAYLALRPSGDTVVYQGKPIRTWALQASAGDPQAIAAIRALGTNAVPGLVDVLERKESFVRQQVTVIGRKVPRLFARPLLSFASKRETVLYRSSAAKVLGSLGPEAAPAIPALGRALHDPETQVCW